MESLSIHPRHWKDSGNGVKKNTSKPHKGGGKLARKQAVLSRRRLAHSATLQSLPSGKGAGFKAPGSMNVHKGNPKGSSR